MEQEKKIQWPPNDSKGNPISLEEWETHPGNFWRQLKSKYKRVYSRGEFKMPIKRKEDGINSTDKDRTDNKVPTKETDKE